jgi:hypothetical protein
MIPYTKKIKGKKIMDLGIPYEDTRPLKQQNLVGLPP